MKQLLINFIFNYDRTSDYKNHSLENKKVKKNTAPTKEKLSPFVDLEE